MFWKRSEVSSASIAAINELSEIYHKKETSAKKQDEIIKYITLIGVGEKLQISSDDIKKIIGFNK